MELRYLAAYSLEFKRFRISLILLIVGSFQYNYDNCADNHVSLLVSRIRGIHIRSLSENPHVSHFNMNSSVSSSRFFSEKQIMHFKFGSDFDMEKAEAILL